MRLRYNSLIEIVATLNLNSEIPATTAASAELLRRALLDRERLQ